MKIDFFHHSIGKEEKKSLIKTLGSKIISTGPVTKKFEETFAKYFKAKYCVGLSNWTSGGLILFKAFGINPGDEIITTPMSFVATSNVILHAGAKPIFVDVDDKTGNIDVDLIQSKINRKTKAIFVVHLYGQMCDVISLKRIAKKNKLLLFEDAAHCIEGKFKNIKPGQVSDAAIFSFYATKNITCGEGGAIVTNNKNIYDKLRRLRLHGINNNFSERYNKKFSHWDMDELGYKCNMSDIQASILLPQIKKIGLLHHKRQKIYEHYLKKLSKCKKISFFSKIVNSVHARHLMPVRVEARNRDIIIKELEKKGIKTTINYKSIHTLKYYKNTFKYKNKDFIKSYIIGNEVISLPLYPSLSLRKVDYVSKTLINILNKLT